MTIQGHSLGPGHAEVVLCVGGSFVCVHNQQVEVLQPHNNLLAKSGTDFKDLTRLDITINPTQADAAGNRAGTGPAEAATAAEAGTGAAVTASAANGGDTTTEDGNTTSSSSSAGRLSFNWRHIQITSDLPEDPAIAEVRPELLLAQCLTLPCCFCQLQWCVCTQAL